MEISIETRGIDTFERRNDMPYFSDIQVFYDLLVGVFDELMQDDAIRQKALDSKLLVKFAYREPEGEYWIDCRGDKVEVYPGVPPEAWEPDATLSMELDTAHAFWCGQLNLLGAMSSGEIEADGSVPKLLKMLPVIKPAYAVYVGLLKKKGLDDLIIEEEEED
jgi:putative sterol carrier protein